MIVELDRLSEHLQRARYHIAAADELLDVILGFLGDLDEESSNIES